MQSKPMNSESEELVQYVEHLARLRDLQKEMGEATELHELRGLMAEALECVDGLIQLEGEVSDG